MDLALNNIQRLICHKTPKKKNKQMKRIRSVMLETIRALSINQVDLLVIIHIRKDCVPPPKKKQKNPNKNRKK